MQKGVVAKGGRYVIPIALCRPVISRLAGMKAMVASPGSAPGTGDGIENRTIESNDLSEKVGKEKILDDLKYFHPRIFLAAAGTARIIPSLNEGSNWRRVASWQ